MHILCNDTKKTKESEWWKFDICMGFMDMFWSSDSRFYVIDCLMISNTYFDMLK